MVNAQEWLDKNYPKDTRNQITELNISNKKIKGYLKLEGFVNLVELDCSNNKITEIDFSGLVFYKLRFLNLSSNNFLVCDLSFLSCFVNLEILSVSNNNWKKAVKGFYNGFNGSLENLKNMSKLRFLDIEGTDIDSGLEYLPVSVEIFLCSGRARPLRKKVEKIQDRLYPYGFDIKEWRKSELNQPNMNNFSAKRDKEFYEIYLNFLLKLSEEAKNLQEIKIFLASLEAFKTECTSDELIKEFRETNKIISFVCEVERDTKKIVEDLKEMKKKNELLTQQLEKYLGSEELVAQILQEVNQEFICWKNNINN